MLNLYTDNWCLFEAIEGPLEVHPCRCCGITEAMEEHADSWTCLNSGRRWAILAEAPTKQQHHIDNCPGNCLQHPLMNGNIARWWRASAAAISWDDLLREEEAAADALKSEEQLAAERAARAAAAATQLHKIEVGAQANHISRVQQAQAARYAARGKIAQPCKKLYSCCGGGKDGGVARPTTLHVSSECWRYEYTDPETGRLTKVHTCNWLHPGEDGWQTEWNANRNFKPAQPIEVLGAAAAPSRFAHLGQPQETGGRWHTAGHRPAGGGGKQRRP